jgi:hypothetical protein
MSLPAPYDSNLATYTDKLADLLAKQSVALSEVLRQWPDEAQMPGVYAISTPDDVIVYVGMTVSQVLANRFHDHYNLRGSSDLRGMLPLFSASHPQNREEYRVRWISITDLRQRSLFESFVIGVLQPPFNK